MYSIREREIYSLDMTININKSSCMRFGSRFNVKCANIITTDGNELTWSADTIRYLGVYTVFAKMYGCSFKEAKKRFIVRLMLYLVKIVVLHTRILSLNF